MVASDVDRARTFGERFSVSKFYGNYEEFAKDPEIGKNIKQLVVDFRGNTFRLKGKLNCLFY